MKNKTRKRMTTAAAVSALDLIVGGAADAQAKVTNAAAVGKTFTGGREYAYDGYVKVRATVRDSRVMDVQVLEFQREWAFPAHQRRGGSAPHPGNRGRQYREGGPDQRRHVHERGLREVASGSVEAGRPLKKRNDL